MAKLIGNAPNQVPTNADLGSMAFEDRTNYITKGASVHQPYRNLIINGDMSIAQRSTSVASISSGFTYHTVDRYKTSFVTAGTWTQSQSTDVPTGQGFAKSLKMECTTANASLSSGSALSIAQNFEGQNLQYLKKGTANAESLTISFWVKSNKTGTYIFEIDDNDNSRNISKSYTINSADTWEKKTITFAKDTTGTLDNDNGLSLRVFWWLVAGTTYSSGTLQTSWSSTVNANRAVGQVNLADSTSNEWYITGVQLEAGTTASDFEFLPVDVNLQRCQRYFYTNMNTVGGTEDGFQLQVNASYSGNYVIPAYFPCRMRASPTMTGYSGSGTSGQFTTDAGDTTALFFATKPTGTSTYVNFTGTWVRFNFTANAEL